MRRPSFEAVLMCLCALVLLAVVVWVVLVVAGVVDIKGDKDCYLVGKALVCVDE